MFYKVMERENIADALIPMELIQDHIRVYDQADDEIIMHYRDAAISAAERIMNRGIGANKIYATFSAYKPRFSVPMGNLVSVDAILAYRDGVEIAVEGYRVNKVSDEVILPIEYSDCQDFQVIATAGWNITEVPKLVIQGILNLIANWYEQREDLVIGVSVTEIPFSHRYLFEQYHIPVRS